MGYIDHGIFKSVGDHADRALTLLGRSARGWTKWVPACVCGSSQGD